MSFSLWEDHAEPTSASPTRVPGDRWTSDRGAIPGEPLAYLDQQEDGSAPAVIIEREINDCSWYEVILDTGESRGIFPTANAATHTAEALFSV